MKKIKIMSVVLCTVLLAVLAGCGKAEPLTSDPVSSLSASDASGLTAAEQDFLLKAERLLDGVLDNNYQFEVTYTPDGKLDSNKFSIEIDGRPYAPVTPDFGYNSTAELRAELQKYFTDEFIATTGIFEIFKDDPNEIPVLYVDYNGGLYEWETGDYFGESGRYSWDSDVTYTLVSREGDTVVIERGMYVKQLYSNLTWCTTNFTVIGGKISTQEHVEDIELTSEIFHGNWASYNDAGEFVGGYHFSPDGAATVYDKDGNKKEFSSYSYAEGFLDIGGREDQQHYSVRFYSKSDPETKMPVFKTQVYIEETDSFATTTHKNVDSIF